VTLRALARLALTRFALAALVLSAGVAACTHPPEAALGGTNLHDTVAPEFVLTDQHGRPFDLAAQRGREVVLFFGYTHCPDVCPTTLAALARARSSLGTARDRVVVAFVTVDPARDGPARMLAYVRLFDPQFVGLTAPERRLDPVLSAYHVWHQRLAARSGVAGYVMAHGSNVYFIDPQGNLRTIHDFGDPSSALAADMKALLT